MKRIFLALLLVLTCGLLFACTSDRSDETSTETAVVTEQEADTDTTTTSETTAEATESVTEPMTEPVTEPVTESTTEPVTESATEPTTEPATEPAVAALYQLAPENQSLMQSYVIKTTNGKLIVIDGGIGEGTAKTTYMPAALRAIMGIGEGEYFEVEAWFLSHAHKDHITELSKMLEEYSEESNYKINNIYFDFPEFGSVEYPEPYEREFLTKFKENLDQYSKVIGAEVPEGSTYFEVLNGAVVNSESVAKGLSFEIDDVRVDVLQTWSPTDGTSNLNDTSLVLRVTIGEQRVLFLNDLGTLGGRRLMLTYGDQLKSDIVQMAHHGQGGVSKAVYETIDADVHLWPTPIWVWENRGGIYQIDDVRAWLYGETFHEASERDIVACLYPKYPRRPTRVSAWTEQILDSMKLEFPYIPSDADDSTSA